jgi:hypothetical protein
MIKTKNTVSYNPVNLDEKEIVFAKVLLALRNDDVETYTLTIKEWVEIPYSENVPNENGEMEVQNFINKKEVRTIQRVMTFVEADQLTTLLDSMFTITETGSARRKRYTILGHLLVNNSENVRNVEWELV